MKRAGGAAAAVLALLALLAMQPEAMVDVAAAQPAPPPIIRAPPAAPAPEPSASVTISAHGEALILVGALDAGIAGRFAAVAANAPAARTVVLHSSGGLVAEADRIAELVRRRRLDTYVEGACLSACTVILLAGRDRAASPNARIGFHHPSVPATDPAVRRVVFAAARALYDEAGVSPNFTDRVFATPFESMWFPSNDELRLANVLTRRSLGGETSAAVSQFATSEELRRAFLEEPVWRAIAARHPSILDRAVAAAWEARGRGGNDDVVANAARAVMTESMPLLYADASDELLDQYLQLILEQAAAARNLGYEACDRYARGQLNTAATLPIELAEREMALIMTILEQPPRPDRPIGQAEADRLFARVFADMSEEHLNAIAHLDDEMPAPVRCEAAISLYRGVAALDADSRRKLTRIMFATTGQ